MLRVMGTGPGPTTWAAAGAARASLSRRPAPTAPVPMPMPPRNPRRETAFLGLGSFVKLTRHLPFRYINAVFGVETNIPKRRGDWGDKEGQPVRNNDKKTFERPGFRRDLFPQETPERAALGRVAFRVRAAWGRPTEPLKARRSETGGGEPGVEFGFGGLGRLAQPGIGGVREVRDKVFQSPVFGRGEGGVAEGVGKAPTHLDEVVEAPLIGKGLVVVGSDGGRELVREMPVQGEIGAGRAVVDFEEIALRLEQVEAEIVGYLKHSGVLVGIGGHQAQGAQVVQEAGGIDRKSVV